MKSKVYIVTRSSQGLARLIALVGHNGDDTTVEEQEPILSLKTSSDDAVKPPEHASPNKKEFECLLCDKKFTSAVRYVPLNQCSSVNSLLMHI